MEIAVYALSMDKPSPLSKPPLVAPWVSKEELNDPFQRALIQQLVWLNANLWEMRTNLAIVANKMDDLRARGQG